MMKCGRVPMVRLALTALVLAGSVVLRTGFAQESPLSDAWKGDKLDAKWHVTVLGDAQDQESSIKVENGALRIRGGGSDIWGNNDNGIFIWQPANGDFQVTLEMRGLKRTDPSAKVGIMVRSSLDRSAVNTFLQGMPKGGALQSRLEFGVDSGPGSGCPGADCNPWGDPDTSDLVDNPMPTILQRLTRIGKNIKAERSYDGGKTWVGLRKGSLAERDVATIDLPDDVLVGIGYTSHNSGEVGEALLGPITFVQTAARPTDNGLIAGLAVDANGKPVPDVNLVVKKGNDVIGRSGFDDGDIRSNTASFFLKPGAYTIETAESDVLSAGTPVPFEIKTGQVVDLKVVVGKAK